MCPEEDFSSQFVTDFSWNKKGREDEVRAEGGGGGRYKKQKLYTNRCY